jgi:hypothetical protein
MTGRIGLRIFAVALVIGFHFFFAGAAQAHSLFITATAVCTDSGLPAINYTADSWSLGTEGANTQINILFNGVFVASGQFKVNTGNTFSGSALAPSGTSATVAAMAVGQWGDGFPTGQSSSVTVAIPTDCGLPALGRFTGGGSQIKVGGVRVTRGLTIHCDLLLSNNLEVNWNGHQFHMEEHLTTVACTDDPAIIQAPPAAPLDTLIGIGIGRYDDVDGFTINFTLVDAGEPGTLDKMRILIFETANPANVILDVPLQLLEGGNLQAHFDQPHK